MTEDRSEIHAWMHRCNQAEMAQCGAEKETAAAVEVMKLALTALNKGKADTAAALLDQYLN